MRKQLLKHGNRSVAQPKMTAAISSSRILAELPLNFFGEPAMTLTIKQPWDVPELDLNAYRYKFLAEGDS